MSHKRSTTIGATIGLIVLLATGFGFYIRAYFGSPAVPTGVPGAEQRLYESSVLTRFFIPLAWCEAKWTGKSMRIQGVDATPDFIYTATP
jgi:hypothetical protein